MDKPERPEEQPPREVSAGAKLVLNLPWASCLAGFSGETCGVQPLSPVQADLEPAGTAAAPSEVVPRALPGGDAQNICTWVGPKRAGLEELGGRVWGTQTSAELVGGVSGLHRWAPVAISVAFTADVDAFNLLLEMKMKRRREQPRLPRTVTQLVAEDGSRVYVVGTAHFSDDSKKDVVRVRWGPGCWEGGCAAQGRAMT